MLICGSGLTACAPPADWHQPFVALTRTRIRISKGQRLRASVRPAEPLPFGPATRSACRHPPVLIPDEHVLPEEIFSGRRYLLTPVYETMPSHSSSAEAFGHSRTRVRRPRPRPAVAPRGSGCPTAPIRGPRPTSASRTALARMSGLCTRMMSW